VSFYLPSDPGFDEVRRIRRGEERLPAVFDAFVDRFTKTFGIAPLALTTDTVAMGESRQSTPRLGVVLERTAEALFFHQEGGFNFDRAKQAEVARIFGETAPRFGVAGRFGLPWGRRRVDWAEDLFVYFTEFEQAATWAAHGEVVGAELDGFVAALGLGDQFWCTQRFAGPPIVFVHTDAQAERLRADDVRERWADLYFPLVHAHDEFGYVTREEILIEVDSRESFERDYQSNWYYYFK